MEDSARNAEYTKKANRRHIVKLLRRTPLSRIELAQETGLTRAAITVITRELIETGYILEGEAAARPQKGKPPIPLTVNRNAAYAVGVYWSRSGCRIGLSDFAGNVLMQHSIWITAQGGLDLLKTEILALLESCGGNAVGVGISAPGPLDAKNGMILNPPGFDDWQNTAIVSYLTNTLRLPVYLENNSCVLALYHLETGESRDFLLLLVNEGVGSGVVSDGQLLVSLGHYTSELGHTTICFDGKPCSCGNRGCLEAYASVPNLLADSGGRYASWNELIDAQDTVLLEREADYLSAGIVNIRNMVNIDTVYLAGSIKYGFDQLAPLLKQRVSRYSLVKTPLRILPSFHVSDIGVAAAANLAFTKWLDEL
ncbi:MAG: ROK family protein [Eubacteriales bacterium]